MQNKTYLFFLFLILALSLRVEADPFNDNEFEDCLRAVYDKINGRIIKVEMKREGNLSIYEFDIRDTENRDWDIECDALKPEIIEMEREVYSVSAELFSKRQKIDYHQAKSKVIELYDGEILEIEFEVEESGLPVYEFDIKLQSGEIIKVEINAETGELHEYSREIWQIGFE
ncbi:MAG: PepSY domain-containing protein [Pseudomonadota bacterium]